MATVEDYIVLPKKLLEDNKENNYSYREVIFAEKLFNASKPLKDIVEKAFDDAVERTKEQCHIEPTPYRERDDDYTVEYYNSEIEKSKKFFLNQDIDKIL